MITRETTTHHSSNEVDVRGNIYVFYLKARENIPHIGYDNILHKH